MALTRDQLVATIEGLAETSAHKLNNVNRELSDVQYELHILKGDARRSRMETTTLKGEGREVEMIDISSHVNHVCTAIFGMLTFSTSSSSDHSSVGTANSDVGDATEMRNGIMRMKSASSLGKRSMTREGTDALNEDGIAAVAQAEAESKGNLRVTRMSMTEKGPMMFRVAEYQLATVPPMPNNITLLDLPFSVSRGTKSTGLQRRSSGPFDVDRCHRLSP